MNKTLIFKIGEESFPTVLLEEEIIGSPFSDTLLQAKECLLKVTEGLAKVRNAENRKKWMTETPNNIIAFLGDRGSGKTSCMRTLVNICKDCQPDCLFTDEIDPSFFDEKHNILEIMIGSLYGIFKRDMENLIKKQRREQESLREIHEQFRKVKSAMKYLDDHHLNDGDNEYDVDALQYLDEGGKIRLMLKDLIDKILTYKKKNLLILSIDDLDLNIRQSYVMMEYVRKFLLLPNLVLIIAAKYEQLFNSICLDLSDTYKSIDYRVSHKDVAEMAERYLNKMLPLNHRFNMPETESYMDATLIIKNQDGTYVYDQNESVELRVPSMIFEKTRFLFYNSPGMPSRIIPRNLRDLRMLVTLLANMQPINDEKSKNERLVINKRLFKEYFFKEWMAAIDPEYRHFAQSLLDEENLAKINKFVIRNLYEFFLSKIEKIEDLRKEIEIINKESKNDSNYKFDSYQMERQLLYDILNPANSFWNVSIGDVVFIINHVKKTQDSNKTLDLLFFIETFYSMKLYETYDKLTDLTSLDGLVIPEETESTAPELKTSVRSDVPDYFRLVGGSFFALTGDFLTPMPPNALPLESRELTLINAKFLLDEIVRIETEYKQQNGNIDNLPNGFVERLRLCEFFMLCISHREDQRGNKNPRLYNEPLYLKKIGATTKNLVFDISSPFVNAVCPELTYKRFSDKIYDIAKKTPGSLVRLMYSHENRKKANKTWEVMSKVAIRNMEVLEDLTSWLHDHKEENKPDKKGRAGVLRNFFLHFRISSKDNIVLSTRYSVKTYDKYQDGEDVQDKSEEEKYYLIHFSALSVLRNALSELFGSTSNRHKADLAPEELKENKRLEDERKDLFNSIFAYDAIFQQKVTYSISEVEQVLSEYCSQKLIDQIIKSIPKNTLSLMDLAEALAKIRVVYGLDFNKRLPMGLQFYYDNCVRDEYDRKIQPLLLDKLDLESQIKDMDDEKEQVAEQIRLLRKAKADLEKERIRLPQETVRVNKELEKAIAAFEFYQQRRYDTIVDNAEMRRVNKEIEKSQLKIIELKASQKELSEMDSRHKTFLDEIQTNLDNAIERRNDIDKARRKIQREFDLLLQSIKNTEENFKTPKQLVSLIY